MTEGLGGKRKVRANEEKGRVTVINQKLKIFSKKYIKNKQCKKKEILRIAAGCWPNKEHCGLHVGKKSPKDVSQGFVEKNQTSTNTKTKKREMISALDRRNQ